MSSWSNRGIPRKRDLSQIPEAFRPTIITRAERPEVVLSESFQQEVRKNDMLSFQKQDAKNEIIYPASSQWTPMYQTQPTISVPKVPAKELTHNDKSYVFVILRNIQQTSDNDLWLSAYHSIRTFYTNRIIIIDDNSSVNTVNGKLVNTEVIYSEFNGAGEILPYYYFQKYKWADAMIFIHDSMTLYRAFTDEELDHDVVFHWHFTESDQTIIKKCISLLSSLSKSKELEEYVKSGPWIGCFGGGIIIGASVMNMLEEKYGVSKLVTYIRTRKQREIVERIIGIVLSYEKQVQSNFGDILKYPFKFESNNLQVSTHNVAQSGYNTAIIKVWRGR